MNESKYTSTVIVFLAVLLLFSAKIQPGYSQTSKSAFSYSGIDRWKSSPALLGTARNNFFETVLKYHPHSPYVKIGTLPRNMEIERFSLLLIQADGNNWRRSWRRWESLSPAEKERLRRRYKQWKKLSPKKRKRLLRIYKTLKKMPPEERRQLIPLIRRWNTLTPKEKGFVLKKLREYGFDNQPKRI